MRRGFLHPPGDVRNVLLGGGTAVRNRMTRWSVGRLVTWLGVFVLLALILPTSFWWFVLGAVLIYVGACVIR